ncbi:MAG: NCS2 family permease [Gemmataceae bacterium]
MNQRENQPEVSTAMGILRRYFRIEENNSTIWKEIVGGLTTFVTMAYILVVNPALLLPAFEKDLVGALTIATGLTCMVGCLLMGLYANRPIGVAPYMGENAFLALFVVTAGVTWQQLLGTVFVSGLAFLVLTLLGLRKWLAGSLSPSMKYSFAVGIGLFLFFVGANQTGLVTVGVEGAPVRLGSITTPEVQLAILGFFLIMILMYWRIPGAILIGIAVVAILGFVRGVGVPLPEEMKIVALPWSEEYDVTRVAGKLDIHGVLKAEFFPILLTLFLISFLDTMGTLVALGSSAGLLDEKGDFPEVEKPMLVDSIACVFSGFIGTTTSGAYIESGTGIREGARTGLAAVVIGVMFGISLFFIPCIQPIQGMAFAYGPALMTVGVLMIGEVRKIDFDDFTEKVPALVTITMMVFTYNIANGLTAGLALYPLFKVVTGRWKELKVGSIVLGVACLLYYVVGQAH